MTRRTVTVSSASEIVNAAGPGLLVLVALSVRGAGFVKWSVSPDAFQLAEGLCVAAVISLSMLGVIDTLRVRAGREGWVWSVGRDCFVKRINLYGLYGLALLYLGWGNCSPLAAR